MEKLVEVRGEDSLSLDEVMNCQKVLGIKTATEPPDDFKQNMEEAKKQLERIHKIN